jgi:multidrug efflux pump subunit AcrA (membrane-fusion protein)
MGLRFFACGSSLLIVAFGAFVPACSGVGAEPPDEKSPATTNNLVVGRGTFVQTALLTGELQAVRADSIHVPRTPSWSVRIRWMEEDGAIVKAGQKILEFDNAAFAADLEDKKVAAAKAQKAYLQQEAQSRAETAEKSFQVQKRKAELDKAKLDANVPKELMSLRDYQDKQLGLQRAETELVKAEKDLEAKRRGAREELAVKRAELDKSVHEIRVAEKAINALILTAPRDGILVVGDNSWERRRFDVGDTAWVGMEVMRIPDLTEMKVTASLSDVDAGLVDVGMPVEVVLDTYPEVQFSGVVTGVATVAQETGFRTMRRAFRVTVSLDETDPERMRPGMSVKAQVQRAHVGDVLLVPRAGLSFSGDHAVAVLESGEAVEVDLGPCNAHECVVDKGLTEGDRLRASQS